jgi:primosomal protein N' (replication factor Y)
MPDCAEVAVGLPIPKTFTYRVPSEFSDQISVGKRVLVPFQKRKVTGYVLAFPVPLPRGMDPEKVKEVFDLLDDTPLFDHEMLAFFKWIATYYLYPLGEVIKTGLPPGLTVETRRVLKITATGKSRLGQIPSQSEDYRILQALDRVGETSLGHLSRHLRLKNLHARIHTLKSRGWVTEEPGLREGRTQTKTEPFVISCGEASGAVPPHLTPKESEILSFIRARKRISRKDLRQEFRTISAYLPRLVGKGLVTIDLEERYRDPLAGEFFEPDIAPMLNPDQEKVLSEIENAIAQGGFRAFLLHGITGSGKTEVYMRAVQRVIEKGKEAIILVPEISLTPQLIGRFKRRFDSHIAVLHSGLSPGERYDEWRRILKGEVRITIGARSAIFAPFKRLGMIIVDEEHEASFKQEEKLKYNARDLAVMRAKMHEAVFILGSATPSVESFFNAQTHKFHYLRLPRRVESRPLPTVEIVDMRMEKGDGKSPVFSARLKDALVTNMDQGHQSLIFLNRRGFAHFVLCRDCGWTFRCPNCSVTLTYHAVGRILQCHHCGFTAPTPTECPQCQGYNLYPMGVGTQKVQDEIRNLVPFAKVARMDRDTTTRKGAYARIIRAMASREIDILIGTQMIVKGHDFPGITLVGILCADTVLNFPDFRAAERTFQLLTQAAGRAGRGDAAGRVIIQTYNPDHYSIQKARDHHFVSFYQDEIAFREELKYPPFSRLANLRVSSNNEESTERFAKRLGVAGARIKRQKKPYKDHVDLLGPCTAPLAKVKGKYRWQLLIKSNRTETLHRFVGELIEKTGRQPAGIQLEVDIDPVKLM